MSDSAFSINFIDHGADTAVTARTGFALIFRGGQASSHDEPVTIEQAGSGWHAALPGDLQLDFEPVADAVELGGMRATLCRAGHGLGVVSEIHDPPHWQELDATRFVTALFDTDNAVLAYARRPTGAGGHGQELLIAHLWSNGQLKSVEDARISTIYDGEGRPRQASMELWLPGEDLARRAFGRVSAGASLALEGIDVHAALMTWQMERREGAGLYELTVREPAPAAA